MEKDVKVNRPLMIACRKAIRENSCFKRKDDGVMMKSHQAQQSKVILCLEEAMNDEESNGITHIYIRLLYMAS